MGLCDRILGAPWVYERLRLAMLGGGPAGEVFGWLGDTRGDILIDIGCGTGLGFERLNGFSEYHGFDTDARALRRFRKRPLPESAHLYDAEATAEDLERIRPTKALMIGVLHHLSDEKAADVLAMLGQCRSLRWAIALDPVFMEREPVNNILCRLDRGKFVRTRDAYEALIEVSGLWAAKAELRTSGNGVAFYFCTLLERKPAS